MAGHLFPGKSATGRTVVPTRRSTKSCLLRCCSAIAISAASLVALASAASFANGKDIVETRDAKRGVTIYVPAHVASTHTRGGPGRWEVYPYIIRNDSGSEQIRIKVNENATSPDPDFAQIVFVVDGGEIDLLTLAKDTHLDPPNARATASFDFGGELEPLVRQIAAAKQVSLVCFQGPERLRNEVRLSEAQLAAFRFILEKYDSLARS